MIRTSLLMLACLSGFIESSVMRVFNFVQIRFVVLGFLSLSSSRLAFFASFAVLCELCVNVSLFLTTDSFHAKLAKDRKARKEAKPLLV